MNSSDDSTRIDLGDDLLAERQSTAREHSLVPLQNIEDELQNATIMMKEGFVDEAKKLLRSILIQDAHCIVARKLLDEIHSRELQELFALESKHKPKILTRDDDDPRRETTKYLSYRDADSDVVFNELNDEFELGLTFEDEALELFKTIESLDEFGEKIKSDLSDQSSQDLLDIGIAFFEMKLLRVSLKLFDVILKRIQVANESESIQPLESSVRCLMAQTYFEMGLLLDAKLILQPIVLNPARRDHTPLELLYWFGRIELAMNRPDEANTYFTEILKKDPNYRDVQERINSL